MHVGIVLKPMLRAIVVATACAMVAANAGMSADCASDVQADMGFRALAEDTCRSCHSDGCCPLDLATCGTGGTRWWRCRSGGSSAAGVAYCSETSTPLRMALLLAIPVVSILLIAGACALYWGRRGAAAIAAAEDEPGCRPARKQWVRMNL